MRKLTIFKSLLVMAGMLVGVSAWGDSDITWWKVSSAPTGGTPIQVKNSANTENVLQVAFGSPSEGWTATDGNQTVSYKSTDYTFPKYTSTSSTNGNSSNSLAADGSTAANYIAFVPKYDGTLIVVVHNMGTGNAEKPTWFFEDGVAKSGTIIGSGSANIAYDGQSDLKTLNGGTAVTGGIKFSVSAGKTYTMSINGSKPRWSGVIYDYNTPSVTTTLYEKGTTGHNWADSDLTDWVVDSDHGTVTSIDGNTTIDKVTSSIESNKLKFNSFGYTNKTGQTDYNTTTATAYTFTKNLTTQNNTVLKLTAEWAGGGATSSVGRTRHEFTFGDIIFTLYGQSGGAKIKIGDGEEVWIIENATTNVSTYRNSVWTVDLEINQVTNEVSYSLSTSLLNSGTPVTGTGTTKVSGSFNSVVIGLANDKLPNWSLAQTLNSIVVKETEVRHLYTVKAKAGETILQTVDSGDCIEGVEYTVTKLPFVIKKDESFYKLTDAAVASFCKTFTMGTDNETTYVDYTLDETIKSYLEGESVVSDGEATDNLSNGFYGHVAGSNSVSLGTLPAGLYTFYGMLKSDGNRGLYLRDASKNISTNTITSLNINKSSAAGIYSVNFNLPTETTVILTGYTNNHNQYNQSAGFDYVYIIRTGDLPDTENIVVTDAGYATYVSDYNLDFTFATTKAYKVNVTSKGVATLTQVDEVPAKTPVLLYADGGNGSGEAILVTTDAVSAVTGNDLVAGTGAAVATTDGDYTNMILNNVDGIGFYFANNQTVAANRAYLHIATTLAPDAAAARMTMVFADEETTGIKDITASLSKGGEENVYNLRGQRVAKPTRGMYIMNGKKVIIK